MYSQGSLCTLGPPRPIVLAQACAGFEPTSATAPAVAGAPSIVGQSPLKLGDSEPIDLAWCVYSLLQQSESPCVYGA
eukprot:1367243-Amphidinium_carterae.1